MAVDLLMNAADPEREPIPHFLRHDQESVFWLSVWCPAVLMEPKNEAEKKKKQRNIDIVRAWETCNFEAIADTKKDIRHRNLVNRRITLLGKAASLIPWFRQWRRFWRKIDNALLDAEEAVDDAQIDNLPPPTFDLETVGGLFTRDAIMEFLNGEPSASNVPPTMQPEVPDTAYEGAPLLSHIFPKGRSKRVATRTTAATSTSKKTAQGNRKAAATSKRKASSKKVEKVTGKSPPASPSGRKKKPSTAAKGSAVKAAKKTTAKKAATAVKTKAKATTTKSVAAVGRTAKNPFSLSDAEDEDEDEESETIGAVVEHRYALRSRKAAPAQETLPKKVARKAAPASSSGRRKKPSTPVKETAVKAAAKRATVKKTATRKAVAKKDTPTAVTKKAATKKAKIPEVDSAQDTTSVAVESANTRDEAVVPEPGENDMRRRLRPRKRN